MKVVVSAKAFATFLDDDAEEPIADPAVLKKLDQAKDDTGPIAEYLGEEIQAFGLEGGAIELLFTPEKGLRVVSSFDASRALDEDEMQALMDDVAGQWSDGAGENYAPEIASSLGIVVHLDDGDRRAELFDNKGKKINAIGGDVPTKELDTEETALLTSVFSEPGSDESRRLYAAWLERRGDARGEFIDLQLRGEKGLKKDQKRAAALLAKQWREWAGPVADVMEFKQSRFERGFLANAFLTGDVRGKPRWNEIIGHPSLATLTSVECFLPDEHGVRFLRSPSLKGLRHLTLRSETLTAVTREEVVNRPEFCGGSFG
jgi:uncharacterized protein (TIGR02996 family)